MFINRVAINFESFLQGDFTDLLVKCLPNQDGVTQHFNVHRLIMAASSEYFKDALKPMDPNLNVYPDELDVPINGVHFESFLKLVYEGFIVVGEGDADDFIYILKNVLNLTCLEKESKKRKCDSTNESGAKRPKIKKEPGTSGDQDDVSSDEGDIAEKEDNVDQKPTLGYSLQRLSSDQIKKLALSIPNSKTHLCGICNKSCFSKQVAIRHIMIQHVKRKDYKCSYCDLEFFTSNQRTIHISKKHSEEHRVSKLLQL